LVSRGAARRLPRAPRRTRNLDRRNTPAPRPRWQPGRKDGDSGRAVRAEPHRGDNRQSIGTRNRLARRPGDSPGVWREPHRCSRFLGPPGMGRLEGIRVLVTRPRPRAAELCALLEAEGAEVTVTPLLEIMAPEDDRALRAAAQSVSRYAWVLFASPSAVEAFAEATRAAGTFAPPPPSKNALPGPETTQAARPLSLPIALGTDENTPPPLFPPPP